MKPSDKFAPRNLSEEEKRAITTFERIQMLRDDQARCYYEQSMLDRKRLDQAARRRFGIDWD